MVRERRFINRNPGIPKESRTTMLFDHSDTGGGVFYRCWNCGFICNDKRDSLGDESSGDAIEQRDFQQPHLGIIPGRPRTAQAVFGGFNHVTVAPAADSDGNPQIVTHNYATSGGGCPQCHSLNWRGDY